MLYFIIFIIFLIPVIIYDYRIVSKHRLSPKYVSLKYYYFELLVLILVAGLRNFVGGDTIGYMNDWYYIPTIKDIMSFNFLLAKYGPAWYILSSLCKTICKEFYFFQLIHAILINSIIFMFVYKYCKFKYTVILIYFVCNYLYFNMEILRQSISIVIFLLTIPYFIHKQWAKYYLLVLLCLSFHKSSVILLVIPFFYKFIEHPMKLKTLVITIIVSIIIVNPIVLHLVFDFLPSSWSNSFFNKYFIMERATIFGEFHALFKVCVFYILSKYIYSRTDISLNIKFGMNLYLLFSILGFFLPISSERLLPYYSIILDIVLVDYIYNNKNKILTLIIALDFMFTTYKHYSEDVSHWVSQNNYSTKYYFYELYYPLNSSV